MQYIQSPNHFAGRAGQTPRWVIVHGTAGFSSAYDVAEYFANPNSEVSATYVIGQNGTIIQCVSENDSAWGNGVLSPGHDDWWDPNINPNYQTISIEHVKPHTDNSDAITEAQFLASAALILGICQRWNIPMREADGQGGITGHYSIDPVNRSRCPGPYPWDRLWTYLQGEDDVVKPITLDDPEVTRYFKAVGDNRWQCLKTGYYVFAGMLGFYTTFGGSGKNGLTHLGLPLGNEVYPDQGQPRSYQKFERGILAYDPAHHWDNPPGSGNVYVMHVDKPLPGTPPPTPTPPKK